MGLMATVEFRKLKCETVVAKNDQGQSEERHKNTLYLDDGTGEGLELKIRDPDPFRLIPKGEMIVVELTLRDVPVAMGNGRGTYPATAIADVRFVGSAKSPSLPPVNGKG